MDRQAARYDVKDGFPKDKRGGDISTTFVVSDGDVEITRSDQPICVVPLRHMQTFLSRRSDAIREALHKHEHVLESAF